MFAINEGFVLPEGDVDDAEQHNKIDTVGRNLKVKVEEAVKGNGNQAAQCPDGHEKSKRIGPQPHLLDLLKTSHQKKKKSGH